MHHPQLGRPTTDPAIRRIAATPYPYVIFYEANETEIIIHAVRHAARDPSTMPGSGEPISDFCGDFLKRAHVGAIYGPGTNIPAATAEILRLIWKQRLRRKFGFDYAVLVPIKWL